MSVGLRVMLFAASMMTMTYFLVKIRKNRLQIDYAIFWSLFSFLLLFFASFPGVVVKAAKIIGVESPANLVFTVIIFLLILRLFSFTMKLSKTNQQIESLTQELALYKYDEEKKELKEQKEQ